MFIFIALVMNEVNEPITQLAKYHNALGFDEDGMKYEAIADDICRAVNQVQYNSRIYR